MRVIEKELEIYLKREREAEGGRKQRMQEKYRKDEWKRDRVRERKKEIVRQTDRQTETQRLRYRKRKKFKEPAQRSPAEIIYLTGALRFVNTSNTNSLSEIITQIKRILKHTKGVLRL